MPEDFFKKITDHKQLKEIAEQVSAGKPLDVGKYGSVIEDIKYYTEGLGSIGSAMNAKPGQMMPKLSGLPVMDDVSKTSSINLQELLNPNQGATKPDPGAASRLLKNFKKQDNSIRSPYAALREKELSALNNMNQLQLDLDLEESALLRMEGGLKLRESLSDAEARKMYPNDYQFSDERRKEMQREIRAKKRNIRELEDRLDMSAQAFKRLEQEGYNIQVHHTPAMPASNSMFYAKMREMQAGIISSLDMPNRPVVVPSFHDGMSIDIKAPTRQADKFYNDVVNAFDSQNRADISKRFNARPDDLIKDIAYHGGGVILSYDQIRNSPAASNYFNLKDKSRGRLLKNVEKDLITVVYNDEQEVAMLVLNLNRIDQYNGEVHLRYSELNKAKSPQWVPVHGQRIERSYDDVAKVDREIWKHTQAVVGTDNPRVYGHLWQRDSWGHSGELLDDDFFNVLFNGHSEDARASMNGKQSGIGEDYVEYWRGWGEEELETFEKMGWGMRDEHGVFEPNPQYSAIYGGYGPNSMLMGEGSFVRRFYPGQPDLFIDAFDRQANYIAAHSKTQIDWVNDLYNSRSAHKVLGQLETEGFTRKEILSYMQSTSHLNWVGVITFDDKTVSGMRLVEIPMVDLKSLDTAIKHNAIIIPRSDAYKYRDYLNRNLKASAVWNFIHRTMFLYKYGWLSLNPGTVFRNWVDTDFKTAVELGDGYNEYRAKAATMLSEYNTAVELMLDKQLGNYFITQEDVARFFDRPDLRAVGINHTTKSLYYPIDDFIQRGPTTNLTREHYAKARVRSSDIRKGPTQRKIIEADWDTGQIIYETIEENPQTFWQRTIDRMQRNPLAEVNNHIENVDRLAIYLESLDTLMSPEGREQFAGNMLGYSPHAMAREAAFSRTRRIHFDYGNRNPVVKKIEVVFPFLNFTTDNLRLWYELLDKRPWLSRAMMHFYQPVWKLQDLTPEQIEESHALQTMITQGGIPLLGPRGLLSDSEISGDDQRTYMFKLNPAFFDAFGAMGNPMGALRSRLNSVITNTADLVKLAMPFEEWFEKELEKDPEGYYEAGRQVPQVFDTIQQFADLIPLAGTVYSRLLSTYKQSTGDHLPTVLAGATTGAAGITSHVQLLPTKHKYARGGRAISYLWDTSRPTRVNDIKRKRLSNLRLMPMPDGPVKPLYKVSPLPHRDSYKTWSKGPAAMRPVHKDITQSAYDKVKARKMSAHLYGLNINLFR